MPSDPHHSPRTPEPEPSERRSEHQRGFGSRPFLASLAAAAVISPELRAERRAERQREREARAHSFELTTPELFVRGLDEAHDGVVVGHLTDIHVGPRTPDERILAAVDALNEARPDIVFLTGDYVTRKGDPTRAGA